MNSGVGLKKAHNAAQFFCMFLVVSPIASLSSPALHSLTKEIMRPYCSHVAKKQHALLTLLKETRPNLSDATICDPIIDALEKDNTFPMLEQNKNTLAQAMHTLNTIPGFYLILRHILVTIDNPDDAKGPLYVLERATAMERLGCVTELRAEKRMGMQEETSTHASGCCSEPTESVQRGIFDIVSKTVWIKCKNINWQHYPVHAKHLDRVTELREQFLTLQDIVDNHNKRNETDILFVVSSKNDIPESWQKWLDQHHIAYFEQATANLQDDQ